MRLFLTIALLMACCTSRAAIHASSGIDTDVQAKIDLAVDGDTVTLPAGEFTWDDNVRVAGKGITVQGAGAGWAKGASSSSVLIGTGSKTFVVSHSTLGYVPGEAIIARRKYNGNVNYMIGTVTSYSGTTLIINVTSTGGSGTLQYWSFEQPGATIVSLSGDAMRLGFTKDNNTTCVLRNIHFKKLNATTPPTPSIGLDGSGAAIVMRDCRFQVLCGSGGGRGIRMGASDMGIVLSKVDCDTGYAWPTSSGNQGLYTSHFLDMPGNTQTTWDETTPYGDLDTTGRMNMYVEGSWWQGANHEAMDWDGGARLVMRHNVFDSAGLTSHGADTGNYGGRWIEFYNNEWIYEDMGAAGAPSMNYFFFMRGGTGLFTDNVIPNMTSTTWGNKVEIKFMIEQLRRSAGPFSCWSGGYPCPRGIGIGRVDGSGDTYGVGYGGDPEPIYLWNNTGAGNHNNPSLENYCTGAGCSAPACGNCCANAASGPVITDFVQEGRDYFLSAKPGYVKFQYPHPLIDSSGTPDPGVTSGVNFRANMLKLRAR